MRFTFPAVAMASALLAVTATTLASQTHGPSAPERYKLDNGLEVLLVPDRATQVVAVEVWYEAGSRYDPAGRTGLAKLFEDLMFAGSQHVPPGGHGRIVEDVGGRIVAEVDEEVARFGEVLPSSRLALGLWLEAERMRGVAVDDSVVARVVNGRLARLAEEVRNEPYRAALSRAIAAVYDSSACTAAWVGSTVAAAAGTAAVRMSDVAGFFAARYRPGKARLVVAGDFDPAAVKPMIRDYFGGIAGQEAGPDPVCAEAAIAAPKRIEMTEPSSPAPAAGLFFAIPPHDNPDTPALELLEIVLARGSLSRLAQAEGSGGLRPTAWQAGTLGLRRAPGVFAFFGAASAGTDPDSLAGWFRSQAAWAASGGLTETDLARAKEVRWARVVSTGERPGDRARTALHAATFHPDLAPGANPEEAPSTVTLEMLHRVARNWLAPDRGIALIVNPGGQR